MKILLRSTYLSYSTRLLYLQLRLQRRRRVRPAFRRRQPRLGDSAGAAAAEGREGEELLFDYGVEYWDEQGIPRFSPKRLVIDYF